MLLEKVRIFETMSLICYFVICKKNSSGTKSGSLILDKFTKFCIQEKRSKQQVQTLAQITRITYSAGDRNWSRDMSRQNCNSQFWDPMTF